MHIHKLDVSFLRNRRNPAKYKKIMLDAGIGQGMKILDYGCGIGNYSVVASGIIGDNGLIVAADNNAGMIKYAKEEIQTAGINNVKTLLVDKYVDIIENDFDFIFLIDVLHHMKNPREVINYMYSHIKADSKLLIKFEHFKQSEIKEIISWCECKNSSHIMEDYWVLY